MNTVFLGLLDATDKAEALSIAASGDAALSERNRFIVDPADFRAVPRTPFAYWVSERVRRTFADLRPVEEDGRVARIGLTTHDDFRWLRLAWESDPTRRAAFFAKGGAFSRYYGSIHLKIAWEHSGRLLKVSKLERLRRGELTENNSRCWNERLYFRPGLTWSRRTLGGLSLRVMPQGCIFADKGPAIFCDDDDETRLLALLGIANSSAFRRLIDVQISSSSFEVGVIQQTPVPTLDPDIASLARRAWSFKRSLDTETEQSYAFLLPALLQVGGGSVAARAEAWGERVHAVKAELVAIQAEIDERCLDLYGIDAVDRDAMGDSVVSVAVDAEAEAPARDVDETEYDPELDGGGLAAALVSWAVGVAVGRFDVRLATGERELPGEPEPFDPLPVCSPGMLVGDDGLPAASVPAAYAVDFPRDGVLVDDPGDARDLTAAVRVVFDAVFDAGADARWGEAAALLDPGGHDIRAWLRSSFFERHLKLYSKSRRKAPILWQLGTASARYSVWLYAHRLNDDSLFQLQSDLLTPKLAYEERQLINLVQSSGGSTSAKERRDIEAQQAFVGELRVLLEEVKRVAPLWRPTLDDGIVLVMAPLWRLVPHKSWQRELKNKWAELAAGKYDWAQLAMHLWPARVVPKCAVDRSLAIAHGLEDVFWVEDEDGKWQPRDEPTKDVDDLIRERTSAAVKDTLGATA